MKRREQRQNGMKKDQSMLTRGITKSWRGKGERGRSSVNMMELLKSWKAAVHEPRFVFVKPRVLSDLFRGEVGINTAGKYVHRRGATLRWWVIEAPSRAIPGTSSKCRSSLVPIGGSALI